MHSNDENIVSNFLMHLLHSSALDLTFTLSTHAGAVPCLIVEFTGPDLPALLHRNGELLLALEHLATQALRLLPHEHDQVSFDAGHFKARRDRSLERAARHAILAVRASSQPFHFPPMSSRERRMLHLALANSGLLTQSEGDQPHRHLVLYPK